MLPQVLRDRIDLHLEARRPEVVHGFPACDRPAPLDQRLAKPGVQAAALAWEVVDGVRPRGKLIPAPGDLLRKSQESGVRSQESFWVTARLRPSGIESLSGDRPPRIRFAAHRNLIPIEAVDGDDQVLRRSSQCQGTDAPLEGIGRLVRIALDDDAVGQ